MDPSLVMIICIYFLIKIYRNKHFLKCIKIIFEGAWNFFLYKTEIHWFVNNYKFYYNCWKLCITKSNISIRIYTLRIYIRICTLRIYIRIYILSPFAAENYSTIEFLCWINFDAKNIYSYRPSSPSWTVNSSACVKCTVWGQSADLSFTWRKIAGK